MMSDLLKEWHDLIAKEARAAAEVVMSERTVEVERALTAARESLSAAADAQQRAESASGMAETLRDLLTRAPREVFLHDATLAVLTALHVEASSDLTSPGGPYGVSRQIADRLHQQNAFVLIQRHAAPLPAGRYAVVISFHRIDGGEA